MRPLTFADLEFAVRAVLAQPTHARAATMRDMLLEAKIADDYRIRSGQFHPCYGSGTLMAAAYRRPLVPRPSECCVEVRRALALVLEAIARCDPHQ